MTVVDRSDLKAFVLLLVIATPLGIVRAIQDWGPGFDPGAPRDQGRKRAAPK